MAKKTKEEREAEKASKKSPVTREEFESLKTKMDESNLSILDAIKSLDPRANPAATGSRPFSVTPQTPVERPITNEEASVRGSNYTLNPAHQVIFEQYFDPADGFEARLEYPYFTIIVPMKLSNADDAWKKYYKTDTRMKYLQPGDIEGGIRRWCEMVARNLKYDKTKKLKI